MQAVQQELSRRMALAQQAEQESRFDDAMQLLRSVVALQPAHAPAWLRLSYSLERIDDYAGARSACLRAAELVEGRPGAAVLLPHVTMRLLAFEQRGRIHDLVRAADLGDPRIRHNAAAIAQHLWLSGHFDKASEVVEAGLRERPDDPLLVHAAATVMRFTGRRDDATRAYERAIELAPGFADAHWALAYHQPSDPRGSRLDRIREALAATKPGTLDHAQLCYAAFKESDDAGDVEAAWSDLSRGAETMRSMLPWNARADARRVDAMIQLTRQWRVDQAPSSASGEGPVPVFVVGLPRTGTTLLERILGNHPDVAACGELNDFRHAVCTVTGKFVAWPPVAAELSSLDEHAWRRVGEEYIRRVTPLAAGARVIVDKNPLNFDAAGLVARALPGARILCLVRDPMDAGFSNLKELFVGGGYGYSYALEDLAGRLRDFHRLLAHWEATIGSRFARIRYESLVLAPEETAREVLGFCNLGVRDGLSLIAGNHAPVTTASSSQVREPIHRRGIGAWRRYGSQLGQLQALLGGISTEAG